MLLYALTIFLSAFLLFQVQPLIAKYILPWFGGSPAVWTVSMLFFQVFLLGGYAYAHLITSRLKPRVQAIVHIVLLLIAAATLPITPASTWQPDPQENPTWRILALLAVNIGLPYLVLSATSPLIQSWFHRSNPGRSPYRLYALSNVGSMLGLLTFPFVFEPLMSRGTLSIVWSVIFAVFVLICGYAAYRMWQSGDAIETPPTPKKVSKWRAQQREEQGKGIETAPSDTAPQSPTWGRRALWLLLSFTAVILLLSVTNQMTQDVSVIPFLWILPLSLYLLTFIIAFDNDRWYVRTVFAILLIPALFAIALILIRTPNVAALIQWIGYPLGLFIACMVLHGELACLKPDPRYLTGFFLTTSFGGALGGIFVGLIAPLIFNDYYELHLGLILAGLLGLYLFVGNPETSLFKQRDWVLYPVFGGMIIVLGIILGRQIYDNTINYQLKVRNFYGTLALQEYYNPVAEQDMLWMLHGMIYHGAQYTNPDFQALPTTYFASNTGIELAMVTLPATENRHLGIVGLGVGTLASYAYLGDQVRLYEINPQVVELAENEFTFLELSEGEVEVILGDARLSLEREEPQNFDILVLDAFSGDGVPVHLLTREAFEVYLRHLKPGGLLAINVINRHVDLEPVIVTLAEEFSMSSLRIDSYNSREELDTSWMFLSTDPTYFDFRIGMAMAAGTWTPTSRRVLWTDDYTSLFPLLK